MTLNVDLIRARCAEIEESVSRLEKIRAQPRDEFLADRDIQDIACYRLLVAIEAAIALCYHVSARQSHKVPEEYAECFRLLGETQVIPVDLAARLQLMARFRNLLVHMYWKLDYSRVYDVLDESLADLRAFCSSVAQLI
ncbi:MAG: DUF86 domain-containing protein [Acidiferrobacterales bacterium]